MKFVNGKAAEIWSETWKFLRDRLKLQQKLENFEITDFWIVATGFLYLKTDLSWIDISCYAECHIYILRVARPRVWYIVSIHGRKCAYLGLRNVRFTEHLACFVFLLPPFWDFLFCLNTDDIKTFEHIKLRFFRPVFQFILLLCSTSIKLVITTVIKQNIRLFTIFQQNGLCLKSAGL